MPDGSLARPALVIVSGAPCTGKTSVARRLSQALRLPFFRKDSIKESLFDTLGCGDIGWNRRLSAASLALLHDLARTELCCGRSIGVEANFHPELATQEYRKLCADTGARPIEIHCQATASVTLRRFRDRALSGSRHVGHQDEAMLDHVESSIMAGTYGPLALGGPLLRVDTTDWGRTDMAAIALEVADFWASGRADDH